MTKNKKRAIVVCPGRGSYNKEELGYLAKYHANKTSLLDDIDTYRQVEGRPGITELDGASQYQLKAHTQSDNASSLIYACAYADFLDINRDEFDIVCVTGNSMGWYIALAVAGALQPFQALKLIETMGHLMGSQATGAQLIYPIVDEQWKIVPGRREHLQSLIDEINRSQPNSLYLSIDLGGYWVFAGTEQSIAALQQKLPVIEERYPMKLFNHAAYHTPLMRPISQQAMQDLEAELFSAPHTSLIDGTGKIWSPLSCEVKALYQYTLDTQVTESYLFNQSLEVAIKEFAPDNIILLGPGSSLGGSIAQNLIASHWLELNEKQDFIRRQKRDPFVLSMGIESQRQLVV